jgi:hypothetical protein
LDVLELKLDVSLSFSAEMIDQGQVFFPHDLHGGDCLLILLVEVKDDLFNDLVSAQQVKIRLI